MFSMIRKSLATMICIACGVMTTTQTNAGFFDAVCTTPPELQYGWNLTKQWSAEKWDSTKQWGEAKWNGTKEWSANQWDKTKDWSATQWGNTKQWCGDHKGEIAAAAVATAVVTAYVLTQNSSSPDTHTKYVDNTHSKIDFGRDFTQSQKADYYQQNMARNGGVLRDDRTGEILKFATQCRRGVVPDPMEAQVDHIYPRSLGGANSAENAQIISRRDNILKSNHVETDGWVETK